MRLKGKLNYVFISVAHGNPANSLGMDPIVGGDIDPLFNGGSTPNRADVAVRELSEPIPRTATGISVPVTVIKVVSGRSPSQVGAPVVVPHGVVMANLMYR